MTLDSAKIKCEISEEEKQRIIEILRKEKPKFVELKPEKLQGEWIYEEHTKILDGGGRILCRGYKCSNCGFFRHRKRGMSKYCEECGAKMEECQDDSISGNDTAKS